MDLMLFFAMAVSLVVIRALLSFVLHALELNLFLPEIFIAVYAMESVHHQMRVSLQLGLNKRKNLQL